MEEGSGGYLMSALPRRQEGGREGGRRAFQSKRSPAGESKRTREAKTAHVLFLPLVSSGGEEMFYGKFRGDVSGERARKHAFYRENKFYKRRISFLFFVKLKLLVMISALFVWLINHQPAVLFSQNKSATRTNQSPVFLSQNESAPAISRTNRLTTPPLCEN
jgi:hypothetical protein